MGLFALAKKNAPKENIEAAIANIRLFLEEESAYPGHDNKYLLETFALPYLKKALSALEDK